ncbi:TPA: hypothetical protein OT170_002488 [Escherichia coli]|nr:hypothetical protein [Escherichia coli]
MLTPRGARCSTPASTESEFQNRRRLLSSAWWWCVLFRPADAIQLAVIIPDYFGTPDQLCGCQILIDHYLLQTMNDGHQFDAFSFVLRYFTW